jgi:uncharacterized membrane protein YfcA
MPFEQQIIIYLFTVLGSSFGIAFGGGSFVVLPVLFLLGVDPKIAVATNVVAAVAQLATGGLIFAKNKKIHFEIATSTTLFYLIGGLIGAFALININPDFLKMIVAIAIIIFAIFGLFKGKLQTASECRPAKAKTILVYPLLVLVGTYQVMTTAGAGTILTFILVYLFDLRLKCSIYTRQFVTLPTMLMASIILIAHGIVDWVIFLPLVLGRITGALIGSEIVMHTRNRKLAFVFAVVVIVMAIRTLFS